MSPAPDGHPHDDVAVYAVDALDPAGRAAVEAHLAGCGACRAELDAQRHVLARLTTDEAPPPALWDRIVANLPAEPRPAPHGARETGEGAVAGPAVAGDEFGPPTPAAGQPRPRPAGGLAPAHLARRRPRGMRQALALAAAAALVAVAAAGATLVATGGDDDGGEVTAPAGLDDLAAATLEDPTGMAVLAAEGEDRARLAHGEAGSFVMLDDLPTLEAGRAYQLWALDGPAPVSLGVLGDGSQPVVAVSLPDGTVQLAISEEPAAGQPSPTGPIVASGQLVPA